LTSGPDSPFTVSAQCHPGMIDPADAAKVTIPMCVLGSKDEEVEEIEAFGNALTFPKHVEIFKSQIHGWMSARAKLENNGVKQEYERGYRTVLEFFGKHL